MTLKKTHRFTNKERNAINGLLCDLDELDNKPRRLYSAIRDFATAFFATDKHYKTKENHADILLSIDEAEKKFYLGESIRTGILFDMDRTINQILREETKQAYIKGEEYVNEYQNENLLNKLASKIVEQIFSY